MRGGARGLWISASQEPAFANYQVPSTLCNRAAHFSKLRDTRPSQPLSFLFPLGPRRRVFKACSAAGGGRKRAAGGTGCSSQARADAEVGESGGQLGAAGRASFQAATRGKLPCLSPGSQPDRGLEGGAGLRRETTRRGYFRVPRGRWELSFQHPLPGSLPKYARSPPPKSRAAPRGSSFPTSGPCHRVMEIRRLPTSSLLPLRSTRFGDSKLSCPHPTRPPSLGAANATGEIPPSTLAGWLPFTCARKRRVEESVPRLGNK